MNYYAKTEELNDLLNHIRSYEQVNDDKNTLKYILKFHKKIEQFPPGMQFEIKNTILYFHSLKRIAEIYRKVNDHSSQLFYLKKIIENQNLKKESINDQYNFYLGLILSNIHLSISSLNKDMFLDFSKNYFLISAKGYVKFLKKFDNLNIDEKLIKLFNKYQNFIIGLENKNYYVVSSIVLPFPIYIDPKDDICFTIDNIQHILTFKLHKNPQSKILSKNCFCQISDDKYGLENNTSVNVCIKALVPIDDILNKSIKAINYFINEYRIISGLYWADEINVKMGSIPNLV